MNSLCVNASAYVLGHVQLFPTPWTVALQASLSMGIPRQDYWSGLPFFSPGESSRPQGLNLCLLHWQAASLLLNYQGSPICVNATVILDCLLHAAELNPEPQGESWESSLPHDDYDAACPTGPKWLSTPPVARLWVSLLSRKQKVLNTRSPTASESQSFQEHYQALTSGITERRNIVAILKVSSVHINENQLYCAGNSTQGSTVT